MFIPAIDLKGGQVVQLVQGKRLALASDDGSAAWLDVADIDPEDDGALAAWLADDSVPKVLHDAKGPMLALAARGWKLTGLERDTALSAYLARPDQRSYDLADLTLRYLKRELRQDAVDADQLSFDAMDDTTASDTAMLTARAVLDLADVEVAVLDRGREVSDLERRPHPGVLAHRDAAAEDQGLRAAADRREAGPHDDVVRTGGGQLDGADLALAGGPEPEGTRPNG